MLMFNFFKLFTKRILSFYIRIVMNIVSIFVEYLVIIHKHVVCCLFVSKIMLYLCICFFIYL